MNAPDVTSPVDPPRGDGRQAEGVDMAIGRTETRAERAMPGRGLVFLAVAAGTRGRRPLCCLPVARGRPGP